MHRSLAALALLLGSHPQQSSTSAGAVDLRLAPRVGEPVRGLHEFRMKLVNELISGKKRDKVPFEYSAKLEFVDEFLALDTPAPGDLDARRTYVSWQEEEGKGTIKDSEMTGVRMGITRREGAFQVELGGRVVNEDRMPAVLRHARSIAGCELPAAAAPGESFVLEPSALVFLLLDQEHEIESCKGSFKLKSVDEAGLATLEGQLMAATQEDPQDPGKALFEGACTLLVDTAARSIRSVSWKGTTRLLVEHEEGRLEGTGTFESQLVCAAGAPAREALARKVVYRDVPRALDLAPVVFELPSHWFDRDGEDVETFSTSLHGAEALVTLEFRVFQVPDANSDETMDAVIAEVEKGLKLTDEKGVSSLLGWGRTARFHVEAGGDGKPYDSLLEFYPCGPDRLLRIQLYGEPKALAAELEGWPRVRKSLRKSG